MDSAAGVAATAYMDGFNTPGSTQYANSICGLWSWIHLFDRRPSSGEDTEEPREEPFHAHP